MGASHGVSRARHAIFAVRRPLCHEGARRGGCTAAPRCCASAHGEAWASVADAANAAVAASGHRFCLPTSGCVSARFSCSVMCWFRYSWQLRNDFSTAFWRPLGACRNAPQRPMHVLSDIIALTPLSRRAAWATAGAAGRPHGTLAPAPCPSTQARARQPLKGTGKTPHSNSVVGDEDMGEPPCLRRASLRLRSSRWALRWRTASRRWSRAACLRAAAASWPRGPAADGTGEVLADADSPLAGMPGTARPRAERRLGGAAAPPPPTDARLPVAAIAAAVAACSSRAGVVEAISSPSGWRLNAPGLASRSRSRSRSRVNTLARLRPALD